MRNDRSGMASVIGSVAWTKSAAPGANMGGRGVAELNGRPSCDSQVCVWATKVDARTLLGIVPASGNASNAGQPTNPGVLMVGGATGSTKLPRTPSVPG